MRLRNIPGADEVIRNCDWVIKEAADKKGKWNTVFGNENPIHIEVGMGKGQFIHRSTTSESSVIRAFFCVPYRKESSFRQKKPCRICSICVSMPVNFRKSLQKTKWQRST